jgi:hypothetical protein
MLFLLSLNVFTNTRRYDSTLLAKEKRTIAGNTEYDPQPETALCSRNNCSRSNKDKGEMEYIISRKWLTQPRSIDFEPMMFSRE